MAVGTPITVRSPPLVDAITVAAADDNSLVIGQLDHVAWVVSNTTMAPLVRPFAGDSTASGSRSLVHVAFDEASPAGAFLERPFTVPVGVTSVTLELDELQLPVGATGSAALSLDILDATGITVLGTISATPTGTPADVATAEVVVVPGVEYRARVTVGAAQFRCGRVRVRPSTVNTATAGVFARAFRRIDVYGALQDTTETTWRNPRFPPQNGHSFVDIETDAETIAVEVYSNTGDYVGAAASAIVPQIDRFPGDELTPSIGVTSYLAVSTGARAYAPCSVRVAAGLAVESAYAAPASEPRCTSLAAIYVPATSLARVTIAPIEILVLSGDSKLAGSYADLPGADSLAYTLRQAGHRVVNTATGGQSLAQNVGTTLTVAACTAWALKLARHRPTKVVLGIGRNDWTAVAYTPANLVTQIGNLADAIHAVSPATLVVLVTWTSEVTEADVSGTSWNTERENIRALAASRLPWCSYLDAARYWTPAEANDYTKDTVHPNSLGYGAVRTGLLGYQHPWTANRLTPTIWCEAGWVGAQSAAAFGSVTAVSGGGATCPTVTLTGTPLLAGRLLLEIKVGGARGVARFRWSFGDAAGRSWAEQNILTAASVLLAPLGVTVNFGNDFTYDNLMHYRADVRPGSWVDLSGNGNHLVQASAIARPELLPATIGGRPGFSCTAASFTNFHKAGLSIPAPYTFAVVGQITSQAAARALVGSSSTGSAPLLFSGSASVMTLNAGGAQFTATVNATNPHAYVAIVNGASSSLRVDGVATAGTLGANTISDILVGSDNTVGLAWDRWFSAFALIPRAISVAEALALEARWRWMYSLP